MNQTRLESLVEACINTGIGFIVAMSVTQFILIPLWDLDWGVKDNFLVTLIFTAAGITRSYLIRRFFNNGLHKLVHRILK